GLQGVAGALVGIGLTMAGFTHQFFPGLGAPNLGWGLAVVVAIAVVATSNAVNLTDGVDGLAASCTSLVLVGIAIIAVSRHDLSVAILAAALAGSVVAFLLFNWFPARVFMGDAGSLALGCAIVALTVELHLIWLLPVLGIVFVVEAASVVVNVTAIRRFGTRVLRASPIHHHFEELGLREQRLVVAIGAGRSGLACAVTLAREGNQVVLVDRADGLALRERTALLPAEVEVRLGGYPEDIAADALLVCPSPGVRWGAPELQIARAHGVPVRSEMDLVFERCRARICGITGTNGNTTTPALVAAILERAGEQVHLGGNIGRPMLDRLDTVRDTDWVVLELSPFQIESVLEPRCAIACVLNVTPDHLDRHGNFESYAETKRRLVRFAVDDAVLGFDDP